MIAFSENLWNYTSMRRICKDIGGKGHGLIFNEKTCFLHRGKTEDRFPCSLSGGRATAIKDKHAVALTCFTCYTFNIFGEEIR